MTDEERANLRALCDAVTPGPWKWYWKTEGGLADCGVLSEVNAGHAYAVARCPKYSTKGQWQRDASFIAATRTAVPALLAEVERLRERERVLREAITAFIAYEATGADQGWLYWDEHFESLRSALAEPKP